MGRGEGREAFAIGRRSSPIDAVVAALGPERSYLVGGGVRDKLLGKEASDIDLLVAGLEREEVARRLAALPGRVDYTGESFAVFRYRQQGQEIEIALPRVERSTGAGHQDFIVEAGAAISVEDDLSRRDFNVNALAQSYSDGRIIDLFGGREDIKAGRFSLIKPEAFAEDPLRILRALALRSRSGLHPDDRTKSEMERQRKGLSHLPGERIQKELDKILSGKDPAAALALAQETAVLKEIIPELDFDYQQNNRHHSLSLGLHSLDVLDRVSQLSDDIDLRLAALLHDIGKPASAWTEEGETHYYRKELDDGTVVGANHALVGSEMTREIMSRLRYSNQRQEKVAALVEQHMWGQFSTERGARRFLAKNGPLAEPLLLLRQADGGQTKDQERLLAAVRHQPINRSQLAISGKDLIGAGFKPGQELGLTLDRLLAAVVDDPSLNQRDKLLELAANR